MTNSHASLADRSTGGVVVGAYARLDTDSAATTRAQISGLDGVTVFDLGDPDRVGFVIEAPDLDTAHRRLTLEVRAIPGVLGSWPISVELDDELESPAPLRPLCDLPTSDPQDL